jgi:hypothetical protein
MTIDESMRIAVVQQRLFRCIQDELKRDGHHKSYEGAIDVSLSLPNVFEQERGPRWTLEFHCYLLCDGRHQSFTARTLPETVSQFEVWANEICAPYEMERFARDMGMLEDEDGEADGDVVIYGDKRQ